VFLAVLGVGAYLYVMHLDEKDNCPQEHQGKED